MIKSFKFLKPQNITPEEEFTYFRYRGQVLFTVSFLTLLGNAIGIALVLGGLVTENTGGRIFGGIVVMTMAIVVLVLLMLKQIEIAGIVFCFAGTLSVGIVTAGSTQETTVQLLYIIIILIAGIIISPVATLYVTGLSFISCLTSNIIIIVRTPNPPPVLGSNTALISSLVILGGVIVYIFSNNLNRFATSARKQTRELSEVNEQLRRQGENQLYTTRQISDLTGQLGEVFREQRGVTTQQAILVTEVASTTTELDAAARRIADNALSVAQVAERALKSAEMGTSAAQDGVDAISNLRERVQNITESVRYLSGQIQRINEVTLFIGEIADETNLLALNATIEAAGAREYGRRFSAVAEEVQRLAKRAGDSVVQIQGMVTEVTEASTKSLAATEEGLRQAQAGADLISRLNYANNEIITLVNQTSELAASIANATQQQRNASAHIVTAIEQISVHTADLARTGDEANDLVSSLELTANSLRAVG
jgi:methyl-accepting chemotaxis protein